MAGVPGNSPAITADSAFAAGCAWVDGDYVPIDQARIPLTDTGFTRSDCTYDVVSVWDGAFFRLDKHLARFAASCRGGHYTPPVGADDIPAILQRCVQLSGLREAYVEMIVTRGVPPPGERDPRRFPNRFYAFAIPYVWILPPAQRDTGVDLVIARDTRRIDPAALDPRIKNFHWGDLTRGLFEAYARGAGNVVLLDNAGCVTEGPGFNLFALLDGRLLTPAGGVLEGITRETLLELAAEAGHATAVTRIRPADLAAASEIFLTSTAGGVMPVTRLDGAAVADGRPGPLTQQLRDAYWAAHKRADWTTKVDYDGGPEYA